MNSDSPPAHAATRIPALATLISQIHLPDPNPIRDAPPRDVLPNWEFGTSQQAYQDRRLLTRAAREYWGTSPKFWKQIIAKGSRRAMKTQNRTEFNGTVLMLVAIDRCWYVRQMRAEHNARIAEGCSVDAVPRMNGRSPT